MSTNGTGGNESNSTLKKLIDYIPLFMFVGFGGMLVQRVNSNRDEYDRYVIVTNQRLAILESYRADQMMAMRELSVMMAQVSSQLSENAKRWEQFYLGKPRP